MIKKSKALSAKQKRFVDEYLIDLNATAAYKRAGYKCTGHAAESAAEQLLRNIEVRGAIEAALAERAKRTEITVDRVVQEMWAHYQRCVEADEYTAATRCLELLGRHVGAFPNKHEHSGPGGEPIPITIIRFNQHPDENAGPSAA